MKTVLAVAALSLCFSFAGHAAGLHPVAGMPTQSPVCIQHDFVRVNDIPGDRTTDLGCAQFLSTSRVVQPRRLLRG